MKILVACANGVGTSLMMKMKVQQALQELNLNISDISHTSISQAKNSAQAFDIVFCADNFVDMFKDASNKGVKVIGMKNILSVEEAKQRLSEAGLV